MNKRKTHTIEGWMEGRRLKQITEDMDNKDTGIYEFYKFPTIFKKGEYVKCLEGDKAVKVKVILEY